MGRRTDRLIRISAPHFVAGAVVRDGRAARCAPILRYMAGWTVAQIEAYCRSKGWTFEMM